MIVTLTLAVAVLALALGGGYARAADCSSADIDRAAERVGAARKSLAARSPQAQGTDIAPEAQKAIGAIKAGLGELVGAYMRCAPAVPETARIERELTSLVRGASPVQSAGAGSGQEDVRFVARASPGKPVVVGVSAEFPIQCGSDTVLAVFAADGASWKPVLHWQSKPYAQVSGALGSFEYAISPRERSDDWFVVAKSIAPQCSSTWSTIGYTVMRPGTTPDEPKILQTGEHSIWWGNEDFGRLTVRETDFNLRFHTTSLDTGILNREWVGHFSVTGDSVRRIQPVANSPRDFVEEWIAAPWAEAIHWSDAGGDTVMQAWHEKLSTAHSLGFEAVRGCPTQGANHYQIELQDSDDKQQYYFYVIGSGYYVLTKISQAAECNGEILPDVAQEAAKPAPPTPPSAPVRAEIHARQAIERVGIRLKSRPLRPKRRLLRPRSDVGEPCVPEREDVIEQFPPTMEQDYWENTGPCFEERPDLCDFLERLFRDCR